MLIEARTQAVIGSWDPATSTVNPTAAVDRQTGRQIDRQTASPPLPPQKNI